MFGYPEGIRFSSLYEPVAEEGGFRFVHGAAVHGYGESVFMSFAFNAGDENSLTETLRIMRSLDGGDSFLPFQTISDDDYAVSHGSYFEIACKLFLAVPFFRGLGTPLCTQDGVRMIRFTGLHTRFYELQGDRFVPNGAVIPDFWPLGPAQKMPDGSSLMGGCDGNWQAAVMRIDKDGKGLVLNLPIEGKAYSECNVINLGDDVCVVMRNQTSVGSRSLPHPAICMSHDGGLTFDRAFEASFLMVPSKPGSGSLDDGHFYLFYNYKDSYPFSREMLVLGVGHSFSASSEPVFDDVFLIDEDPDEKWVCYPYGTVVGDQLFVVYSIQSRGAMAHDGKRMNHNDIKLARIPISSIIRSNHS